MKYDYDKQVVTKAPLKQNCICNGGLNEDGKCTAQYSQWLK